jgi:alpha-ketoglutarate-dependent taurine dioxygenase
MKIWFCCLKSAQQGGETPIVDSRKVFQRIGSKIKDEFIQKKVMYVRNYSDSLDLSWENVFQTKSQLEVESYCRSSGIEFEWKDGGKHLKTRQVCQAVATHPKTGETVWFNQAHLFHVSSLNSEVRQTLLSTIKEEDLPRNVYYGDCSPIEACVLDEIREIYQQEAVTFPWQEGDVLMLDNMLTAHGRKPFIGSRKVVVGMAEPFSA